MMERERFIDAHIGNYRIVSTIGDGGFSRVYLAKHDFLPERVVAIKLLYGYFHSEPKEHERFPQEARLLERLKHRNVLPLLDVGIFEGYPYLITEYASGGSLRDLRKRTESRRLSREETLKICHSGNHGNCPGF
jgi:serine/threonine protein kinase